MPSQAFKDYLSLSKMFFSQHNPFHQNIIQAFFIKMFHNPIFHHILQIPKNKTKKSSWCKEPAGSELQGLQNKMKAFTAVEAASQELLEKYKQAIHRHVIFNVMERAGLSCQVAQSLGCFCHSCVDSAETSSWCCSSGSRSPGHPASTEKVNVDHSFSNWENWKKQNAEEEFSEH